MRMSRVLSCCAAGMLAAGSASAGGFELFQHGGRAAGQAGAFTARASDPTAVTYDPAAIVGLDGVQLEAGADWNSPQDAYDSATGHFSAKHDINFPPALYLTWKPKSGPFAFGIGIDAPMWYLENWTPPLNFPGRFITREFSMQLGELHTVAAYDLGDGYSVGAGLRYDYGQLEQGENVFAGPPDVPGTEVERTATAKVDGLAWDLSARYHSPVWGWGAVYRSQSKLTGTGRARYAPHVNPAVSPNPDLVFPDGHADQSFQLPWEARGGVWVAPYPELRIELDVAHQHWSSLPDTVVTYSPNPLPNFPLPNPVRPRNWNDTNDFRLGIEGDINAQWMIYGGVGYEQSPVPNSTVEPGFPRGDAILVAAGFSFSVGYVTFDAGGSYYFLKDHHVSGQEALNPGVGGTYSGDEYAWSGSVRWRF
jgi:long-chain fatty acid transport protein